MQLLLSVSKSSIRRCVQVLLGDEPVSSRQVLVEVVRAETAGDQDPDNTVYIIAR